MRKKDREKNIWPGTRKWCVEDPHLSGVDESVYRNIYKLVIRKGRLRWLGHMESMSEKEL